MNTELKSLISTLFDGEKLVADVINKKYFTLITDALALINDIPGDVAGFSGLQDEIAALSNPINEADLVNFIQLKFASFEDMSTKKAQAIIAAIVNLIASAIQLEQAFVA